MWKGLFAAAALLVASDAARTSPAPVDSTSTVAGQVEPVASGLNVARLTGPKRVPESAAPDVVGAFRFLCGPGQVSADDPIVYPGQPGKAHLHQFFGNLKADAHSTYASLRATGESTCMNELNRSAYWMPAMLDGRGNVVRPDYVSIYYKRRPASDPFCTTAASECVGIPRGLRFIFGWDQFRPLDAQPENEAKFNFKCIGGSRLVGAVSRTLVGPARACASGQQIAATISTPLCWDGRRLDTPDHRSHLADMVRDGTSRWQSRCPKSHPKLLPQFTMSVAYSIEQGEDPTRWTLSSDHMKPGAEPGSTFHSDWYGAWEDSVQTEWERSCIDAFRTCVDGDLGSGRILARGRHYPNGKAKPRLVRIAAGH